MTHVTHIIQVVNSDYVLFLKVYIHNIYYIGILRVNTDTIYTVAAENNISGQTTIHYTERASTYSGTKFRQGFIYAIYIIIRTYANVFKPIVKD